MTIRNLGYHNSMMYSSTSCSQDRVQGWIQSTKPSLEVALTTLSTLLVDREFQAGSCLFTVSNSGLLFSRVGQPARTAAYLVFPTPLSFTFSLKRNISLPC